MIGQLMRWSALVLLVYEASSQADVETLTITRMTWSYTPDSGVPESNITELTVCTDDDNLAEEDDVIRLVVAEPGDENPTEEPFNGILAYASCAIFSEGGELPLPSTEAAFYKLTVSSNSTGDELKSGNVSFAYPVSTSEIINCGETMIGRLTLTLTGDEPGPTNCFEGSSFTPELCYVNAEDDTTVCVTGLDANSTVEVCMTNIQDTGVTLLDSEAFTANYISYGDVAASFGVTLDEGDASTLTELLRRVEEDGSVTVHSCSDNLSCDLNPFSPSTDNYELCGVFTENNAVTHVGTATFQDLKLTIDSTSPTVDFHFYNVEATSYNVYKDPDLSNLGEATVSFILDCSRISAGSYCNGFIIPDDQNPPTTIAVSFTNATNAVATSVVSSPQERGEAVVSRVADDGENAIDLQPSW